MRLALVPIDEQHPHRVAVMFGPVVLVRDQTPILPQGQRPFKLVDRRRPALGIQQSRAQPTAPSFLSISGA